MCANQAERSRRGQLLSPHSSQPPFGKREGTTPRRRTFWPGVCSGSGYLRGELVRIPRKDNVTLQSSFLSWDSPVRETLSTDSNMGIFWQAQVLPINGIKQCLNYSGKQSLFSTPLQGIIDTAKEKVSFKLLSAISLTSINMGHVLSGLFYIACCRCIFSFC